MSMLLIHTFVSFEKYSKSKMHMYILYIVYGACACVCMCNEKIMKMSASKERKPLKSKYVL